ncbi:5-methyltetrahydropteroyltriglutamate--homocysteine methyltransferase [Natrarchaeobaculum sulfurireducens]|uniref:5-methyltetrahydropteroyltriglutamate--homocysteine methyltransferase n=1 Tax=Natrarchaeobaculum sulfurireducens TaxID=2044521 RepID=A0A346PCV5_9EURY|nr:5-methyltetrahydropteroyltriglutamate--homocysteine methyltransferase [Natrarchaeobaculum sulfurireducens]AXR77350.1 Methionine synthase II (cobalamin-independent) [Natrarchaeobaculum sulfurireducens]AXR82687.1 5-methyltetrahydropteroyltriglutamate--homocysteine methyltransferase [Natrarchaeobaculum sulfurireducens]
MTEYVSTTPGCYPLPDWAKDDLSDLKGHQKHDLIGGDEREEIVTVYDEAREELIGVQQDAGLDRIVEGQLRWDDMIAHPLAVHDAVETRGIVRYYDNNNFYREPVVQGDLDFSGDVAGELEAAAELVDDGLQAVLPGPYSLADLATDEQYGDEADFLAAIADFLAGEVDAFPAVETLFLLEPSLVENAPDDGLDERASEAIDQVAAATDADVIVQPYWGALEEKVYAHLLDADVEAVGFDFVADQDQNLYNIQEYGATDDVSLGLADGQNTLVEDPEAIRDRVDWVFDQLPVSEFETVYLTTNTETFYLPYAKHEEKLAVLAEAAELAEVTAA